MGLRRQPALRDRQAHQGDRRRRAHRGQPEHRRDQHQRRGQPDRQAFHRMDRRRQPGPQVRSAHQTDRSLLERLVRLDRKLAGRRGWSDQQTGQRPHLRPARPVG